MGDKFQDKIKAKDKIITTDNALKKDPPARVKLIAIPIKALPFELIPSGHNQNDERLLVFTGAIISPISNIFHSYQNLLVDSGYKLDDNKAIKFSIPQVHEKKRSRFHNSYFATALSVPADEIKEKFPNSEIIYVKSIDELAVKYQDLVAQRQKELDVYLKQERKKLKAAQDAYRRGR